MTPESLGLSETRSGRPRRRVLVLVGVALLVMVLVRSLLVQSFYIPSGSMEPVLRPGDRILVVKPGAVSSLQRGDVVVFDGTLVFEEDGVVSPRTIAADKGPVGDVLASAASLLSIQVGETDYVKRVVGLPRDRVTCCNPDGEVSVNGVEVRETYLYPGDAPSDLSFDVAVPAGRIWVMGDHRSDSADSRAHLGDPGGGMVRLDDVIGRATVIYWPADRAQVLRAPGELSGIPASSSGVGR